MNDINCPYCDAELEVCHDDGEGYSEDELHQMNCSNCDKDFVFTTTIMFSYHPEKADCLNGSGHNFKRTHTVPRRYTKMECTMCGERRDPTNKELQEILKE
tara:strand:+ start:12062 stop:12364 length:303 start_codon:yes stop_codon:yes gene_type:complete